MCGICGQYNFIDHAPVDGHDIQRMSDSIDHRGPDDAGMYLDHSLGLGFRRLSIIDLSGGHQPMSDQEESVWLVFNGEIYNFIELRKELQARGHVFRTRSDTEVIVHGYKEWGVDVLSHLNGMFGLAIWDVRKRQLILARDPMGIKSIYYWIDSGRLFFGSEIRPILTRQEYRPEVDLISLNLFLRYRYTPAPRTIFRDIRKLAPGTCLIVQNGAIEQNRYYNHKPALLDSNFTTTELAARLEHEYQDAVTRQMISDVPVGLLLSGGLDSGLLLAFMSRQQQHRNTYTIGFGEGFRDDELLEAEQSAVYFNANHHSTRIDRQTFEQNLARVVQILEEPVASPSVMGMYHVCERARQDVKVLLMGQGPDETLGGYRRHLGIYYGNYWRRIPGRMRKGISSALATLPRNETIKRALYSLDVTDRLERYQQVFSILPGAEVDSLFHPEILPPQSADAVRDCWQDLLPLMEHTDELGGFNMLEVRSSLPDELLMYADKISMHHSLEVRVPYLDLKVVEYAERIPARWKVHNGKGKWLHRQVCCNYLSEDVLRRKKRGFAVNVVDEWYRESMEGKLRDTLLDPQSRLYSYLNPIRVQELVAQHQSGKSNSHKIIYSLIFMEDWLRNFIR